MGAEMLEFRLDLMEGVDEEDLCLLHDEAGCPIILTIRSATEGGGWDQGDDERLSRMIALSPLAAYLDVEWATWQRSANIRQKINLAVERASEAAAETTDEAPCRAGRLILSRHDLQGRPPKLLADLLAMFSEPACAVPKFAWRARTVRDNFEAFELMRTSPRPVVIICMGEDGLPSRVLAKKFGAFATFASPAAGTETAPGQLSVGQLRNLYRWDAIDEQTRLYGVIGNPVRHSLSPAVHNAAFAAAGLNAVYLPLRVDRSYESFKAFMVEVLARPWLDFRGFSVTVPHKENAARFLREAGGRLDDLARRLDAVNTIVISPDGALAGYNTDYGAALETLQRGLPGEQARLAGIRAAVLGAGGVARAVAAALVEAGARVTIFNRTAARAEALAASCSCEWEPWEERLACRHGLIANCTSVGMAPDVETSPIPAAALKPGMIVFDSVYAPRRTKLLRDAAACGCTALDGLTMFAAQAEAQFRFWTNSDAPPGLYARVVGRAATTGAGL
jgi:3-dehydroquinate dehydratase/shikimate dehydrogenase